MEWREKHQKSSTLIIREKFCQDIAIGLAKLCHAYGKSLPTRWQSLANRVAKSCQLVGKKDKSNIAVRKEAEARPQYNSANGKETDWFH